MSFKIIRPVDKAEFVQGFYDSERSKKDKDKFALHMADIHHQSSFHYEEIELQEGALERIFLPRHEHPPTIVRFPGQTLAEFGYSTVLPAETGECVSRIQYQLDVYLRARNTGESVLKGHFKFVATEPDLAMDEGHFADQGAGALYCGNFHQFAAYALHVKEHGFIPLQLYLAFRSR